MRRLTVRNDPRCSCLPLLLDPVTLLSQMWASNRPVRLYYGQVRGSGQHAASVSLSVQLRESSCTESHLYDIFVMICL